MTSDDLNWRVEAACFNAWPAPRQIILDGWALRASGGPTRRANSANPLHAGAAMSEAFIERAEAFYRAQGRPAMFRIPAMAGAIDGRLAARGYALDAPTRTLFAELDARPQSVVSVAAYACPEWLDARDRLNGASAESALAYRKIIKAILLPCGFASVMQDGAIVSLAFGAIQGDLLILESVMTDPAQRGRGFGRQCVAGLLGWATGQGARDVALQVVADNVAALGLYRSLGFARELYGYHYRVMR